MRCCYLQQIQEANWEGYFWLNCFEIFGHKCDVLLFLTEESVRKKIKNHWLSVQRKSTDKIIKEEEAPYSKVWSDFIFKQRFCFVAKLNLCTDLSDQHRLTIFQFQYKRLFYSIILQFKTNSLNTERKSTTILNTTNKYQSVTSVIYYFTAFIHSKPKNCFVFSLKK